MTDIVITAANVVKGTGAEVSHGTLGATVTAGQSVVRDPSTNKFVLADSNHATAALRVPDGIALNGGANNQPVAVQTEGPITIGGTLTPGVAYYQSDTPGGICPVADVGSGERSVFLGIATSASVLALAIKDSGVAL